MIEIKKYFDAIALMTPEDWAYFSSKLRLVNVSKHELLLHNSAIENNLFFIAEGIVRLFIPKLENDLTFGFLFKNEFVTGYDSFITRKPSEYNIEALTDCVLWKISYNDLEEVYRNTKTGNLIGRKMAENMFLLKSKREISLLNKTAEERYLNLFSERPEMIKQIPLKYIASYIGVTPQALSRIRKRIT